MILVTGSDGLIGRALIKRLDDRGIPTLGFDLKQGQDVRDPAAVRAAVAGVTGIVILAAVSRVVWAQRDPVLAEAVNVSGLRNIIASALASPLRPWLIFASSREIYGEPSALPVGEDAPRAPLNVYARSKLAGELAVEQAVEAGLIGNIVRFSNVYGCTRDHADRVVPAFARAAASGAKIYLEGPANTFDFTHVEDVADGLLRLVEAISCSEKLPPIHFVSGKGTTLAQLATLAAANSASRLPWEERPSRNYDVARFVGDPRRAAALLGWRSTTPLEHGFASLAEAFRTELAGAGQTVPAM